MTKTPSKSSKGKILRRVFFSLILFLILGESTSRTLLKAQTTVNQDERNLAYDYHKRLGWFPKPNSQMQYSGGRMIDVQHNSMGFRDKPPRKKQKPRLAFLGDSFVWGYDAQEEERFTNIIGDTHPEWEILNLGVSGYGTDQAYLLLQEYWEPLQIDSVILTISYNDVYDNNHNCVYGGYYKPYYQFNEQGLELRGVPVPKSIHHWAGENWLLGNSAFARLAFNYYRRAVSPERVSKGHELTFVLLYAFQSFLKKNNTPFLIVLQSKDEALTSFFKRQGISYVDVSMAKQFPRFGKHWTEEGHRSVAQKLEEQFKKQSPIR